MEPLECSQCPEIDFKSRQNLLRHRDTVHGNKVFKCNTCGKAFSRKDSKKRHEDQIHKTLVINPFFVEKLENKEEENPYFQAQEIENPRQKAMKGPDKLHCNTEKALNDRDESSDEEMDFE